MIPLKLLNRLHLGRSIAARREAVHKHYRAWVYVRPVIDGNQGILIATGGENRVASLGGDPVIAYLVRVLEIHESFLEQTDQIHCALQDASTIDHSSLELDAPELADCLLRLLPDFNALDLPDNVGYPVSKARYPACDELGPISADSLLSTADMPLFRAVLSLGRHVFTSKGLNSALYDMVWHGDRTHVQQLLDWGADIRTQEGPKMLLRVAAERHNLEMVRFLLDQGADINQQDYDNQEACDGPLLCFAAETNNTDLVNLLLARGAAVSLVDFYGRTAFGYAAQCGNLSILQALLNAGADVNALSQIGRTEFSPLAIAINNGHRDAVTFLQRRGGQEIRRPLVDPGQTSRRRHR